MINTKNNNMNKEIVDLFLKTWNRIWNYEKVCISDIGFLYKYFTNLLDLLEKEEIYIKYIEMFDIKSFNFIPPDFSFSGSGNINDNFLEIHKFLKRFDKSFLNKMLFNLHFLDSKQEEKINYFLRKKYEKNNKHNFTKEDKLIMGWEFID